MIFHRGRETYSFVFPRLASLFTRLAGFLRTGRGAFLLIVLATLVTVMLVLRNHRTEPSYQKISARGWLELVSTNQTRIVEVTTAFRAMGPAGVEYLGNELVRQPSSLDEWLLARHQHIPGPFKRLLLKPQRSLKATTILSVLRGLDKDASPAMPMLLTWLDTVGPTLTTSAPLPTNGFSIVTNSTVLGFATGISGHGHVGAAGPNILIVPANSIVTLQTQSVVSTPGMVTTNFTVTVRSISPTVPRTAYQILTNLGSEDPRIIKVLLNPVENSTHVGVTLFGTNLKVAASQSVPLLMRNAKSTDQRRRLAAFSLLRLTLPESAAAREVMIRQLTTKNFVLFDLAAGSLTNTTAELERIIPLTVQGLVSFKNRPLPYSETGRTPAYYALKEFARHQRAEVAFHLQAVLTEASLREQVHILELLAATTTTNEVNLALIGSFTNSPDAILRVQAWSTLGDITGDRQMEANGLLAHLNSSPGKHTLIWLTYSRLGKLGADAGAAVPKLIEGLQFQETHLIAKAAETLGQVGPTAHAALEPLHALRAHPELVVREAVEEAIRKISAAPKTKGTE